jgi:type II secretory pathway pseudopilin PulG
MLSKNATRLVSREGARFGRPSDQRQSLQNPLVIRPGYTSPLVIRPGYTLLELILVLGILVALTGLAVPMALDTLDGHRLRASADRVRGAFAEAKNQAIRSGNEVAFYYQPGFRTFFVLEFNPLVPKPLPPVPNEEAARDATSDIRANILEMGVVFAGADVSPDSRAQVSQVTDVPNYARILFYPDGTAQPARVFLANQTGAGIRVELRALTGTSIASELLNVEDFQ